MIPGTITPVSKSTLQPIGAPRMEQADLYAPSPGVPAPAPEGKRRLIAPRTEGEIREAIKARAEQARAQDSVENRELGDQLSAAVMDRLSPASVEFLGLRELPAVRPDVTTGGDKRIILGLLQRGGAKNAEAKSAKLFFSKFPNPTEAIEEIGAQSVLAAKQIQSAGDTREAAAFYSGMGKTAALRAAKWVNETLGAEAKSALASARETATRESKRLYVTTPPKGVNVADTVEEARKKEDELAKQLDELADSDPRLTTQAGRDELLSEAEAAVAAEREAKRKAAAEEAVRKATATPA